MAERAREIEQALMVWEWEGGPASNQLGGTPRVSPSRVSQRSGVTAQSATLADVSDAAASASTALMAASKNRKAETKVRLQQNRRICEHTHRHVLQ